jgi:Matrixin
MGIRLGLATTIIIILTACGDKGSTPTGASSGPPSPPFSVGTVLTFVSGETGAAVPNASVTLSGARLTADGAGRLTLSQGLDRGAFLDVQDPAFVDRQTLLRDPGTLTFSLWPRESPTGLDPDFTKNVVYDGSVVRPRPMMRIRPGVTEAYIVPSEPIAGDAPSMEQVRHAADLMTGVTGGAIRFLVAERAPANSVEFDLVIDPGDPALVGAVAVARRRTTGWSIDGGTVVYVTLGTVRTSTTAHELGHMFGLGHSTDPGDLMTSGRYTRAVAEFSARERLAMNLMLQRPPGNEMPDNDRGVTVSASQRALSGISVSVVVCKG